MPLTVLSVAYPFAPVRPEIAGGAEQILLALDRALVEAGHRSVVVAAENSLVRGQLIGAPAWSHGLDGLPEQAARYHRNAIESAILRFEPDVIHYHGHDFHRYAVPAPMPSMATLHLPLDHYPQHVLSAGFVKLYCVSESQKERSPGPAAIAGVIPNGVDIHFFAPRAKARNYAVALGRICPEKGFHLALDAAKQADIPLLLAGRVFDYDIHRRYFEAEIRPRLDSRRKFIGAVGPERKRRLLAGARCLIAPSLIDETSSLTAMEALACGAPVVARPAGALPEIVEDGRTGFVADTVAEMAAAIGRLGSLSRAQCRASAERRFDMRRMVERYFETWRLLARESCGQTACSS